MSSFRASFGGSRWRTGLSLALLLICLVPCLTLAVANRDDAASAAAPCQVVNPANQVNPAPDFDAPAAISSDGTNVWVTNIGDNSVTELSASGGISGTLYTISGSGCGFDDPGAISSDGTNVWVANFGDNSVTELSASTGALVQVIQGSSYGFNFSGDDDEAISSDGTDVWVVNEPNHSVTELSASTGALVQVIQGSNGSLNAPVAISSDGTNVWVADPYRTGDSVTELSACGAVEQVIPIPGSQRLDAISSDGTNVWVADAFGNSVTELSASSGAVLQTLSGSSYGFDGPDAISSDGTNVWVANYDFDSVTELGDSVTELSASTGALVQVIQGSVSLDPFNVFNDPVAISSDGTNVWFASPGNNPNPPLDNPIPVTEFPAGGSGSAETGAQHANATCTPPTTTTSSSTTTTTTSSSTTTTTSSSTTTTSSTTTSNPTTTTTPTTTPTLVRSSKPRLVAAVHGVLAVAGGTRLTLACTGAGGSCTITAIMSVVETLRGGRLLGVAARAGTTHRTVVVGRANVLIGAGGGDRTFLVKLNAVGARLLRSRGQLPVHLQVSSGSSVLGSKTLTIGKPAATTKAEKKH